MVLEVDPSKRRISLGIKQCQPNPWEKFVETHPVGSEIEGEIKNITEFGLFVGLTQDLDGMVHLSDLDWNKPGETAIKDYKKGDQVKAKVLERRPGEGSACRSASSSSAPTRWRKPSRS